jgi:hypothetical protein
MSAQLEVELGVASLWVTVACAMVLVVELMIAALVIVDLADLLELAGRPPVGGPGVGLAAKLSSELLGGGR